MPKEKICSFCKNVVEKLWYSNPACCASYVCRSKAQFKRLKDIQGVNTRNKEESRSQGRKIAPVSKSQAERLKRYRIERDKYMKAHPFCECCKIKLSTDLHHRAGKIGDLLYNPKYFCALCRECHQRCENEPLWAKQHGFSVDRLNK